MMPADQDTLARRLKTLDPWQRAVFATACAERLLPVYERFNQLTGQGSPNALHDAIDCLERDLAGPGTSLTNLPSMEAAVEALAPADWDEDFTLWSPYALNAAGALVYALQTRRTGQVEPAVWAASQCTDAIDYFVSSRDDVDFNATGTRDRVRQDPLMTAELLRQAVDLQEVARLSIQNAAESVQRILNRAKRSPVVDIGRQ